ncbi:MAG: hypothetical protein C4539_11090 [Ignavibacteriales bacterium]|nr:MAG: hypothetical protein C4539_11090 [Ignavibacteriales bacterium]
MKRIVSKIIKHFSLPLSPYQRIIASDYIKPSIKKQLTKIFRSLDPFILQSSMKAKIKNILRAYKPLLLLTYPHVNIERINLSASGRLAKKKETIIITFSLDWFIPDF